MNARDAAPFVQARRRLLGATLAAAALPAARAFGATPTVSPSRPQVAFLSPAAGAAAFAQPGDTYYANMGLLEIRARMKSPLAGVSLADARVAVRDYDAARVLAFTDAERVALQGVVERMQPLLEARAPLYARTPWSFIKLDGSAEGDMPHTRGPHIVLPKATVESYAAMHREMTEAGKLAVTPRGRNLLVHEQTHVLERASPARFEPLFTQVFGFTRMTPAPASAWLDAHVGSNPDGPDLVWAFALEQIGGSGWIMPIVTFPDLPVPRMPDDFQALGAELVKGADGWKLVEENGVAKARALDRIPGYDAHFPFPDEDFHPTEIAAVALSHWILQDVPDLDKRPLMPAVAAWARAALA
jgi:hypothetical protein